MIRLEGISKIYSRRGHEVTAFREASMEIERGEYAAIVGPSGSGKTTLLSMVGGMLSPNTGRIWLDGVSLYELSVKARAEYRREKLGFVFQTFNLVPYLTAIENVQVSLFLAGLTPSDQREKAIALLDRVGLGDRLDHKPSELSIGQQQRVALARTLSNNPAVILADEPTGNLDPGSRRVVLDFFDELHAGGATILMVTHDPIAAERATNWLQLSEGAITKTLSMSAA